MDRRQALGNQRDTVLKLEVADEGGLRFALCAL
jgi:hypothetical protein